MNLISRWFADRRARESARRDSGLSTYNKQTMVIARIGKRQEWRPQADHEQAQFASRLLMTPQLEEWERDRQTFDNELAQHSSTLWVFPLLIVLFIIEVIASIHVFKSFQLPPHERFLFGCMLAACLFAITYGAARVARGRGESKSSGRWRWFIPIILVFSATILSLMALRMEQAGGGQGLRSGSNLATAVVFTLATAGPAVIAEILMRKLETCLPLRKKRRSMNRQISRAMRDRRRAFKYQVKISRHQRRWDDEAARIGAAYDAEFLRGGGAVPTDPNNQPI